MNDWKRNETFENIFRRGRHAESTGCRFFGGHLYLDTLYGIVPRAKHCFGVAGYEPSSWCRLQNLALAGTIRGDSKK